MKLPRFIFKHIMSKNTSLGDNKAFPPEEDYPFAYKIIKMRFNEVCKKLKEFKDIESTDVTYLSSLLSDLIVKCKEIEKPYKDKLIGLCENVLSSSFEIPSETLILNIELVDKIIPNNGMRLMPEESSERTFDFDDIKEFNTVSDVILKRRFINSLIQGASYIYGYECFAKLKELDEISEDLIPLYKRIIAINDYLLFVKEENINDKNPHQSAYVEVMLGREDDKTEINVQGLLFPFILTESIRGLFELFASHGLPNENDKAQYIIGQSDFLLAEPWDLRIGVGLWSTIVGKIEDMNIMPYFFTSLCKLPMEEFNSTMQEILAKTKRGKSIVDELYEESVHQYEMNSMIQTIKQKNLDHSLLNDSYLSVDDIDGYLIDGEDDSIIEDDINIDEFDSYVVRESVEFLTESQESKSISAAKKLLKSYLDYTEDEADEFVRINLRNEFPALRTPNGGKFILGVTRMLINGELDDPNNISKLNQTLKIISSDEYINKFDRDINGLYADQLISQFKDVIENNIENEKNQIINNYYDNESDYEIVKINSFEEANKYSQYTSWCITKDEYAFKSYTNNGFNQFYFCLKNGFENVIKKEGENCPLDEYGLSMLAVLVNENGGLNSCTCRWNHDNGGNENMLNTNELSDILHVNFFETFKPSMSFKDKLNYIKNQIQNGNTDFENLFDECIYDNDFIYVKLMKKYNVIINNNIISDIWFDAIRIVSNNLFKVIIGSRENLMRKDGSFVFDDLMRLIIISGKDTLLVRHDDKKYTLTNLNGEQIINEYFDEISKVGNSLFHVEKGYSENILNVDRKSFVFDRWYDSVYYYRTESEYPLVVEHNGMFNFATYSGIFLSKEWFSKVNGLDENPWFVDDNGYFAIVVLNGKVCTIYDNRKIIVGHDYVKESRVIKESNENKIEFIDYEIEHDKVQMQVVLDGNIIPIEDIDFKIGIYVLPDNETTYYCDLQISHNYRGQNLGFKILYEFIMEFGQIYFPIYFDRNFKEMTSIKKKLIAQSNIDYEVIEDNDNGENNIVGILIYKK